MKNIAVDGCQFSFSVGSGTISVTGTKSTKVKCDGKAAYKNIVFSVSGYTGGAITVTGSGTGSGTISGTAQKVKIEGMAAVLEGDKVDITLTGQTTSGTSTVTTTQKDTITVSNAGQSKVKGV